MHTCVMCTDMIRRVAETPGLIAMPTLGCFVPGYLLIVPRRHVPSFGRLDQATLTEAAGLIDALAARLSAVYGMPVLGFEYGLNAVGARRVEHAHWHLLPSTAALGAWLDARQAGKPIASLAELPTTGSYIAVRGQDAALTVYPVDGPMDEGRRLRLRRLVAELDPRVDPGTWDWASHGYLDLIRQTIADLAPVTGDSQIRILARRPASDHA
jgi:diadenosine tetraphosphate (Ap4A) HIT family hydrolase